MKSTLKKIKQRQKRIVKQRKKEVLYGSIFLFIGCLLEAGSSEISYRFPYITISIVLLIAIFFYINHLRDTSKNEAPLYQYYIEFDKERQSLIINNGIKEIIVSYNNISKLGRTSFLELGRSAYVIYFKTKTDFGEKVIFLPDPETEKGKKLETWLAYEIAKRNQLNRKCRR